MLQTRSREGLKAHRSRVAAYADEIAMRFELPAKDRSVLQSMALYPVGELADLLQCLSAVKARSTATDDGNKCTYGKSLRSILEMAEHFDHKLESSCYSDMTLAETLECDMDEPATAFVLPHLRECHVMDVLAHIPELPVFPKVAKALLTTLGNPHLHASYFADLASSDQVITGELLKVANSGIRPLAGRVSNVQDAFLYMGTDKARDVVLRAAMKPLLDVVPGHLNLWSHSVQAAHSAVALAKLAGTIPVDDAYVLGLIHDVGKLLLQLTPTTVRDKRARLIQKGCAPVIAEVVTCGMTHAEAGAHVCRYWELPEEYAIALGNHHEPERGDSKLAALLYLVELWTEANEDLPCTARLSNCLKRFNLSYSDLLHMRVEGEMR